MLKFRAAYLPLLAASLALVACDRGGEAPEPADAENQVANDTDPALTSALEDQILVDPSLAQQSNRNAVRPAESPTQAEYPVGSEGPSGSASSGTVDPLAAIREGGGSACGADLNYDAAWARRLPEAFPLYPNARVTEAAGSDKGDCGMRVVTFRSSANWQNILDWYHTRAVHGGYSSEHQLREGDHVLAGVSERSDAAFYLIVTPLKNGSDVALIANRGS